MFKSYVIFTALMLNMVLTSTVLHAESYVVDTKKSELEWMGKKVLGKHWGTVNIKKGTLVKEGNKLSGEFHIDMTSIESHDLDDAKVNAKLVGHLQSDDFFSVAKHPVSKFKITSIKEQKGQGIANHIVTGNLTIKGITNEISFPAHIDIRGGIMTAKAEFTIDRSKWDVRYGSGSFFDNLGDNTIDDKIWFTLNLIGKKQ